MNDFNQAAPVDQTVAQPVEQSTTPVEQHVQPTQPQIEETSTQMENPSDRAFAEMRREKEALAKEKAEFQAYLSEIDQVAAHFGVTRDVVIADLKQMALQDKATANNRTLEQQKEFEEMQAIKAQNAALMYQKQLETQVQSFQQNANTLLEIPHASQEKVLNFVNDLEQMYMANGLDPMQIMHKPAAELQALYMNWDKQAMMEMAKAQYAQQVQMQAQHLNPVLRGGAPVNLEPTPQDIKALLHAQFEREWREKRGG